MSETLKPFLRLLLAFALPGLAGLLLAERLDESPLLPALKAFCAALILLSPLPALLWTRRRSAERERREAARRALLEAVERHRAALTRNLRRAVKTNDYGAPVSDKTNEALEEFFSSIGLNRRLIPFAEAAKLVSEALEPPRPKRGKPRFDPEALPADGHAFERWVAESLSGFGWETEVTPGSGDQGLDVIARRRGRSLGIQCKLYGSAIGNRAVQEAHAGKAFHGVEAAAVLSNAAFTPGARDLALATGVRLFSPQDIPDLYEKTFGRRRKSA